jgi:hypothetical protein
VLPLRPGGQLACVLVLDHLDRWPAEEHPQRRHLGVDDRQQRGADGLGVAQVGQVQALGEGLADLVVERVGFGARRGGPRPVGEVRARFDAGRACLRAGVPPPAHRPRPTAVRIGLQRGRRSRPTRQPRPAPRHPDPLTSDHLTSDTANDRGTLGQAVRRIAGSIRGRPTSGHCDCGGRHDSPGGHGGVPPAVPEPCGPIDLRPATHDVNSRRGSCRGARGIAPH